MCFMSNDIDILRPKLKLFMRSGMNTQTIIESKLTELLSPTFLTVENESHMHSVPPNSETHFKVTVASEEFTGKRLIQRHRAINKALADELPVVFTHWRFMLIPQKNGEKKKVSKRQIALSV